VEDKGGRWRDKKLSRVEKDNKLAVKTSQQASRTTTPCQTSTRSPAKMDQKTAKTLIGRLNMFRFFATPSQSRNTYKNPFLSMNTALLKEGYDAALSVRKVRLQCLSKVRQI
jgi:hypothetical protein